MVENLCYFFCNQLNSVMDDGSKLIKALAEEAMKYTIQEQIALLGKIFGKESIESIEHNKINNEINLCSDENIKELKKLIVNKVEHYKFIIQIWEAIVVDSNNHSIGGGNKDEN